MKPFFGALYYHLVYVIAGSESFLYLHISTTLLITISNIFIYLIVKYKTKNKNLSIVAAIFYLTFTHLSIDGYAHSSLEHLQVTFLLGMYYLIYIRSKIRFGLMLLSFAIMIKQNVALVAIAIIKYIKYYWKFSLFLFLIWALPSLFFFENFIFNTIIFPAKYYLQNNFLVKLVGIKNFLFLYGNGFNFILMVLFALSINNYYKLYKQEFWFICLLGLSLVSTPLYLQHFIIIDPFMIIVIMIKACKLFAEIKYNKRIVCVMGGVVLAVFNVKNITYNYSQIQDIHYLTKNVTIPHRVKYEEKGLLDLFNFLKNKKEIIYILK